MSIVVLADAATTTPGTDKSFDGLAVYVVQIPQNRSFAEYISEEEIALQQHYRAFMGSEPKKDGSRSQFSLGGRTGVKLQGYSWDNIVRIYIPFPGDNYILVVSKTEKATGSFDATFNQILSTFRFD